MGKYVDKQMRSLPSHVRDLARRFQLEQRGQFVTGAKRQAAITLAELIPWYVVFQVLSANLFEVPSDIRNSWQRRIELRAG